jgi:hypothetical protein
MLARNPAGSIFTACGVGLVITIMSALRNKTQVSQPAATVTFKTANFHTQQVIEAAIMQNRDCNAEGTYGQQHRGQQGGHSSSNTQHLTAHSLMLFTALIGSIGSNRHNKNSNSLQKKICIRTPIKSQVSQCKLKM